MKKSIFTYISVIILMITLTMPTALAAADPNDEITGLRSGIKTVYDIDTGTYSKLEDAVVRKFKDVKKGGWYMSVMCKLVGLSSIDGTSENTMEPSKIITRAMFIKMFVRAMLGADSLDGINPDFNHWAAKDVKKAEQTGLLAVNEYTLANIGRPITRGEMAKIIVRAYNKYESDPITLDECRSLNTVITDYGKISEDHKPYVLITYGSGIINGYPDGHFGADETATRAHAAAIVIRYLDTRERAKVEIPASRATMTLRHDNPHRPMAIEGDTFVKPDGTEVALKIGPSGVLGEEQGVATEIGRAHPNGKLIEDDDLGSNKEFLGQPYLVDEKTGEGHYQSEWDNIAERLFKEAIDKLGHPKDGTTYGPWLMYKYGGWCWVGP